MRFGLVALSLWLVVLNVTAEAAVEQKLVDFNSRLKIRVVTASWCIWCDMLQKDLKKNNISHVIDVKVAGGTLPVSLELVQDDSGKKLIGEGFPEAQFIYQNSVLKYGGITIAKKEKTLTAQDLANHIGLWLDTRVTPELNSTTRRPLKGYVGFMTTGFDASEVPWQPANTLLTVKNLVVQSVSKLTYGNMVTLFGNGTRREVGEVEADGYQIVGRRIEYLLWPAIKAAGPLSTFKNSSLVAANNRAKASNAQNRLWFLTGHGSENSVNTWDDDELSTEQMKASLDTGKPGITNVLVNGTCHGGSFAPAVSCGFFASRPETVSFACMEIADPSVEDYVSAWTKAALKSQTDFDKDGRVSMIEAHWAAMSAVMLDVPFTNVDALADSLIGELKKNRDSRLLKSMSISDLQTLIHSRLDAGARFNASALFTLAQKSNIQSIRLEGFSPDHQIKDWVQMRLATLGRRALLMQHLQEQPRSSYAQQYSIVNRCEQQTLNEFLF